MCWNRSRAAVPACGSQTSGPRVGARPGLLSDARGTSLFEAVVASMIVITTITGIVQLLLWSRRAVWSAGASSVSAVLAAQKLEQLRALAWQLDARGAPVTDLSTDVAVDPPASGGLGLQASPPGTLTSSTSGYVDYVDAQGRVLGTGLQPPAATAYVRRWSILPYAPDPLHTLTLHVVVLPAADAGGRGVSRSPRIVHLTTIRTRSVP